MKLSVIEVIRFSVEADYYGFSVYIGIPVIIITASHHFEVFIIDDMLLILIQRCILWHVIALSDTLSEIIYISWVTSCFISFQRHQREVLTLAIFDILSYNLPCGFD